MFKSGDRVVCAYNDSCNGLLSKGKVYNVINVFNLNSVLFVKCDVGVELHFSTSMFISLKEYRKQKLEKIEKYV